jgi:hypothetical protein
MFCRKEAKGKKEMKEWRNWEGNDVNGQMKGMREKAGKERRYERDKGK